MITRPNLAFLGSSKWAQAEILVLSDVRVLLAWAYHILIPTQLFSVAQLCPKLQAGTSCIFSASHRSRSECPARIFSDHRPRGWLLLLREILPNASPSTFCFKPSSYNQHVGFLPTIIKNKLCCVACLREVRVMKKLFYKHETESTFGLEVIPLSLPLATCGCRLWTSYF